MAVYWPTPGVKGRTFKLCFLIRWDLNFCVRSSHLRGKSQRVSPLNLVSPRYPTTRFSHSRGSEDWRAARGHYRVRLNTPVYLGITCHAKLAPNAENDTSFVYPMYTVILSFVQPAKLPVYVVTNACPLQSLSCVGKPRLQKSRSFC